MTTHNRRLSLRDAGLPIHTMLLPFPAACLVAAFVSDVVYWETVSMFWSDMSAWLLAVGLVVSVLVILSALFDVLGGRRMGTSLAAWIYVSGNIVALVLSVLNVFVHSRDAYTSVVPTGLALSSLVVVIMAVTAWNGWRSLRHRMGVYQETRS